MKSNGTTTILNWALMVVVVGLVWGAIKYYNMTHEARSLQTQLVAYQNKQAVLNNLIAECLEYSKRNPSIDPILEANNLKAKATSTSAKPAAK